MLSLLAECFLCLPNACCADVSLHGAGYPHEHHGLVQQHSKPDAHKPDAHKPDAPQVWLAASLGRRPNTGVRSTRLTTHKSHAIRMTELSAAPPKNVATPTKRFQTLETRLGELHATFPRNHVARPHKGLQRHHAQPSARNTQRVEDAYDTRNPGSLTRPREQPRHEDTNDAG